MDETTTTTYPASPVVGERIVEERYSGGDYARTEPPVERRRFSLGATFLGWAVATFFSFLFLALLIGAIGGTLANHYYFGNGAIDVGTVRSLATAGVVGYLVATFLAFLIGGYAAGRIALWDGVTHGALTGAWSIVAGILLFVLAAYTNDVMLGYRNVVVPFDAGTLNAATVVWAVATLLVMALGGALGGRLGERYHDTTGTMERRRVARGRPL